MKLKCSSELRWNSHCGHGRKTILNYGIYIILQFLYHIFMPQRKMETFLKEQLFVVNISKDNVIDSFEKQDLKSVKLEDTNLGNDFVPIEKVLKAYKSDEYFKELTRLFYNDLVVDFTREYHYKGNDSYNYYFKVLYEKENYKTLVIYKIENNWNANTLRSKLKGSIVEFKVLNKYI